MAGIRVGESSCLMSVKLQIFRIKNSGDLFHNYVKILTTIQLVLVAQSCLTLCDSMDCSLPGSSVHGILQARILEWVVIPFSRGSSQPRDGTWVSYTVGRFFTI